MKYIQFSMQMSPAEYARLQAETARISGLLGRAVPTKKFLYALLYKYFQKHQDGTARAVSDVDILNTCNLVTQNSNSFIIDKGFIDTPK